jgi:hypothetical protein
VKRVPAEIVAGDEVVIVLRTVVTSTGHGGGTIYTDAGALDVEDCDAISVVQ